jgi:hypothetical protein
MKLKEYKPTYQGRILPYNMFHKHYVEMRAFVNVVGDYGVEPTDVQGVPDDGCAIELSGKCKWLLVGNSKYGIFELWKRQGRKLVNEWRGLFGSREDWGCCLKIVKADEGAVEGLVS